MFKLTWNLWTLGQKNSIQFGWNLLKIWVLAQNLKQLIYVHIIFRSFLQIAMRQYFFNLNFFFIKNYYFAFEWIIEQWTINKNIWNCWWNLFWDSWATLLFSNSQHFYSFVIFWINYSFFSEINRILHHELQKKIEKKKICN